MSFFKKLREEILSDYEKSKNEISSHNKSVKNQQLEILNNHQNIRSCIDAVKQNSIHTK